MMQEQIGTLLWELRTARGLSMSELARRAAVSKATLSYWEAGKRVPRVPELETVLTALDVTQAQRTQAFAILQVPRAVRHLRIGGNAPNIGIPPAQYDLLRAMRLRKGWTQEQTADALQVVQATIARWERGERTPSQEQMQALCFILGAREEELVVLTTGRLVESPPEDAVRSWEEKVLQIHLRLNEFRASDSGCCWELLFLSLEREAWLLATQNDGAMPALASVLAHHADHHRRHAHWAEASVLSRRALSVSRNCAIDEDTHLRAVLTQAASAVYNGQRAYPGRGSRLIKSHLPLATRPDFRAWMLSDLAEYAALEGSIEEALKVSMEAWRISKECDNPDETYQRQLDYAILLLQAGRPKEALPLSVPRGNANLQTQVKTDLIQTEGWLALGNLSAAREWLERTYAHLNTHELAHLRQRADRLAQQL